MGLSPMNSSFQVLSDGVLAAQPRNRATCSFFADEVEERVIISYPVRLLPVLAR